LGLSRAVRRTETLHVLLKNAAKKRSLLNLRKKERSLTHSDSLSVLIPQNPPPPDTGFDGVTTGLRRLRRGSEPLPDWNYSHLRGLDTQNISNNLSHSASYEKNHEINHEINQQTEATEIEKGLFRTYCANFSAKCQRSNARISKFIKFLKPKPHLFNSFNLVLIPSIIPLVLIQNIPQFLRTIF